MTLPRLMASRRLRRTPTAGRRGRGAGQVPFSLLEPDGAVIARGSQGRPVRGSKRWWERVSMAWWRPTVSAEECVRGMLGAVCILPGRSLWVWSRASRSRSQSASGNRDRRTVPIRSWTAGLVLPSSVIGMASDSFSRLFLARGSC